MRKTVKILHTVAAGGLIGGLLVYMVLLATAEAQSVAEFASLRASIAAVSNYVLLPSLAIALISGLLSMLVHRPFLDIGWVWIKAALGILMFKGVLTIVGAKASAAARLSAGVADGEPLPAALDTMLAYEWTALITVLAISIANVVLGVWRPRILPRQRTSSRAASTEGGGFAMRRAPTPPTSRRGFSGAPVVRADEPGQAGTVPAEAVRAAERR